MLEQLSIQGHKTQTQKTTTTLDLNVKPYTKISSAQVMFLDVKLQNFNKKRT